jgi:hypothetical protein
MSLRGEITIERYAGGSPDQGGVLVETITETNTFTQAYEHRLIDSSNFQIGGTFPADIRISGLVDQDQLKNFAVDFLRNGLIAVDIPGGNVQDNLFVTVDANTYRYTRVGQYAQPGSNVLIDIVGLSFRTGRQSLIAYTKLNSTVTQTPTDFLIVYYRLYYIHDATVVNQNLYNENGLYRFQIFNYYSGLSVATQAFYSAFSKTNSPPFSRAPQTGLTNNDVYSTRLANWNGQKAGNYYTGLDGFSAYTVNAFNRYYQDVSQSINLTYGTANVNSHGSIINNVGSSDVLSSGNTAPAYGKIHNQSPLVVTNGLVQNIIGHATGAVGPFKDTNNLPTSKGVIAVDTSAYTLTMPELYSVLITTSGNVAATSATYQILKKYQIGYDYNASTTFINYSMGVSYITELQCVTSAAATSSLGNINAIRKFQMPYGVPTNVGRLQIDICMTAVSLTEVASYDSNGVSLVGITGQNFTYKTWDATTTPALTTSTIQQIAVDKVARVIYVATAANGMFKIDINANTVTAVTGPTGAGINGTKCYGVQFNTVNGTDLWGVFSGCIAKSTNGGTSWTNQVPANVITGVNDVTASWANTLQLVLDPYDASQRMLLINSVAGIVYYCVTTSGGITANNIAQGPLLTTNVYVGGYNFYLDTTVKNFDNRFRFSNNGSIYCSLSGQGQSGSDHFEIIRLIFGGANYTFIGASTLYLTTYNPTSGGNSFQTVLLEDDGTGTLRPVIRKTDGKTYAILNDDQTSTVVLGSHYAPDSTNYKIINGGIFAASNAIRLGPGVYFMFSNLSVGYAIVTMMPNTALATTSQPQYGLTQYGWNGSAWVAGNSGSKAVHAGLAAIPGGAQISFSDNSQSGNVFVNTDYYTFHLCQGYMKDDITSITCDVPEFRGSMKLAQTDIVATTVPASDEGTVTAEAVSWFNFAPYVSTSSIEGSVAFANTSGTAISYINALAWSDQRFDAGDFTFSFVLPKRWTANSDVSNGYACRIGLVQDSNLVIINTPTLATSELAKYSTNANFDKGFLLAASSDTANSTLTVSAIDTGTASVPTSAQSYGTTGYLAPITCQIQRSGTTITWSVGGTVIKTLTGQSASTVFRVVVKNVGTTGIFAKSIQATYQSARRLVKVGTSGNSSGAFDPRFHRLPTYTPNVSSLYSITLNGTSATLLFDGQTAPSAGQVQICSGMGKLWFNSADNGKTIVASYPELLTPE